MEIIWSDEALKNYLKVIICLKTGQLKKLKDLNIILTG